MAAATAEPSARFETVEDFLRRVYLSALLLAAASFVVLIAYHRLLFAQRQKPRIVRVANLWFLPAWLRRRQG